MVSPNRDLKLLLPETLNAHEEETSPFRILGAQTPWSILRYTHFGEREASPRQRQISRRWTERTPSPHTEEGPLSSEHSISNNSKYSISNKSKWHPWAPVSCPVPPQMLHLPKILLEMIAWYHPYYSSQGKYLFCPWADGKGGQNGQWGANCAIRPIRDGFMVASRWRAERRNMRHLILM